VKLFLGLSLSIEQRALLDKINPVLRGCFVKNSEDPVYLTDVQCGLQRYLGKYVQTPFVLKDLDPLELNIMSLINKVLPLHQFPPQSLQLIPLISDEYSAI